MTPPDVTARVDDLHVEYQRPQRRWAIVHARTGLGVVHGYRSRVIAHQAANRLRPLIDWSSLHRAHAGGWLIAPDGRRVLIEEQARVYAVAVSL